MKADDELDNLFRDHLAGELSTMRGQAGRAFTREVLAPMRRRVAQQRRHRAWWLAGQSSCTLAASMALGFFVPMWLAAGPTLPEEVGESRPFLVDFEEHVPAQSAAAATLPGRN